MQKIHACPNDYILYRCTYEYLNTCPVCGALRYKNRRDDPGNVDGERPRKRVPAKVMWYAPIIPRLKRPFRNKEHAKLLLLGNVVISKKILRTRKIMVMHSNDRGECRPCTLVDCKRKRYDNAVDVVVRLHDPTNQALKLRHLRVLADRKSTRLNSSHPK